ncbi:MAG: sugar ABC transporter ATP-binding protein [Alphaproteobacteria bacterium]|nr:sugar ABC transporter ATP-binding protein [Alphaproteobacteria bacterium]
MTTPSVGAASGAPPLPSRLSIAGLTKVFGGNRALDAVDLDVAPGEIHGLLGQNGSGKSTLIKILSGFHAPDAGSISIDGKPIALPMPVAKHEAMGLAFVHQNLGLFPGGTVLENLIAGDHGRLRSWRINWREEAARARRLFATYELDLNPNALVETLSPVLRAQLAIVRAADRIQEHGSHDGSAILVLDEPTPFLPQEDVQALFSMMRRLSADGVSIIFVSHDIEEVLDVTDRATVLRDGKTIGSFETREMSRPQIVEMIVGRTLETERSAGNTIQSDSDGGAIVSSIKGQLISDLSFDVRPGEILGLTGLIGSGYDEIPYLLNGSTTAEAGSLTIRGETFELASLSPAQSMASGIVLIPADRQRTGVVLDLDLLENISLPVLDRYDRPAFINHRKLRSNAENLISRFTVKADGPAQPASDLSGGNQQKVVLAKWLQLEPVLVLLDEPTQGIDVGARAEIYDILNALCAAGASVLCATSEYEQLEAIAHRVLVFDRGRVSAELEGDRVTKSNIAKACYLRNKGENERV